MEYLKPGKTFKWIHGAVIFTATGPVVIPYEPITKPAPTTIPTPDENDPFNVPAPKINPTPKGFL
jgi:hypothetical protein